MTTTKHNGQKTTQAIAVLAALLLVCCAAFLFWGAGAVSDWGFLLALRGKKLLALLLVGCAIGVSTLLFQTLTGNPILTPALLGFDSLYVLIKSLMVFFLGAAGLANAPTLGKFGLELALMLAFSLALFRLLFGKNQQDLTRLLLVGVIFGTLFRSLSYLVARLMDPEAFVTVQAASYASFNAIDGRILQAAIALCALCGAFAFWARHRLDILLLGRAAAINLGIDYTRFGRALLILIAVLVSVSTAMVGPVSFFGLLVCALVNRFSPSAYHGPRLVLVSLTAMLFLVAGQTLFERALKMSGVLEAVIELVGGVVFLALVILRGRRGRAL